MRVLKIAGVALLLSAPVFAQDDVAWKQRDMQLSASNQNETVRKQAVEVMARVPFEKAMKGAPYSADTVVESSQTLGDGNRITRKMTGAVYRDGEGRTRREEEGVVSAVTPRIPSRGPSISIVDPVAGFSYSLDPEKKIAWRTPIGGANAIMSKVEGAQVDAYKKAMLEKMTAERKSGVADEQSKAAADEEKIKAAAAGGRGGRGAGAGVPAGGAVGVARARGTVGYAIMAPDTPLEHKTLEGVAVEGRKTVTVIPAGQVGNEQPITITSEEWRSPELGLLVLTKYSDPRSGESIYRLQNIVRAEPDQSLFMVPSDYTIRETGIRKMIEEAARKH